MTIALYHKGATYPRLENLAESGRMPFSGIIRRLANHQLNQRRPRSRDYMMALAKSTFPDLSAVADVDDDRRLPEAPWDRVSTVVLLWPDGNGAGWDRIERGFRRQMPEAKRIVILNGRKRVFEFGNKIHRKMKFRRFVEKSLVVNLLITSAFFACSPVLWAWDALRGRH